MRGAHVPATWLVLAAVGSVQFGAALGVTLFDEVGPLGASFLRVLLAALVLVPIARPGLQGHSRQDLVLAVGLGLSLGGMNSFFYLALDRIPQGITVTFEMVGPLTLALLLSRRALDALWVALAASGVALLSGGGFGDLDGTGIAFALAAGTLWACYIVLARRVGASFPGTSGLALAMLVAAIVTLPAGIADAGGSLLDGRVIGVGLAVALLSSVIPYSLELQALRSMPPRVFGVLMSLEPALGALAGLLVLGQRLSAIEVVAIVLVVAGSTGVAATARRRLS